MKDNRGLSLIEIMVALAVGSVIMIAVVVLLSQGMNAYSKQTVSAQLQNDADIALNQISDAVMEASVIEIGGFVNQGGVQGKSVSYFKTKQSDSYEFKADTCEILLRDIDGSEGSVVCNHVVEFMVQLTNTSIMTEQHNNNGLDDRMITDIRNPLQIQFSISLQNGDIHTKATRTVAVRNTLKNEAVTIAATNLKGAFQSEFVQYFTD